MKISSWVKYASGVTVAAAMLAACSSGGSSSFGPSGVSANGHSTGVTTLAKLRDASLTMPHYVQPNVHTDHGQSFILPDKKKKKGLLYIGDDSTNDVYVYDYPSGTAAGTLTGFDGPYGECTDTKGDVYIANFDAGDAVEYGHGGTSILNTYDSGGTPIGCSVDTKGNVAVTSFDPGEITVFAGGNPAKGTTYTGSCTYIWTAGYDKSDNLIAVGETSSGGRCYNALASGGSSLESLSFSGTIDFPGGSSYDGTYLGLGDQEANGTFDTGTWRVTLSGTTLTATGSEVAYTDTCYNTYTDVVNPTFTNGKSAIVGAMPNKKKKKGANTMIGANLWCPDGGKGEVGYWAYPAGGAKTGSLSGVSSEPYGQAVSF
ncbi:MAG TPA: hypothetical protein VK755_01475 [Candidatus Acidoferrales bacterium]|nr:hypothetical protein [Candidatus Acidoferrales bacterium]